MTRTRRLSAVCAAITAAFVLAGCDPAPSGGTPPPATGDPTFGAATSGPATSGPAPATSSPATVGLTCADVRSASVYSHVSPYNLAGEDGLPLVDGLWTGPGGISVVVQPACAVGELVPGAGPTAAVALMAMTAGTTGRYWAVATCRREGRVYCSPMVYLDDREPIESIAIAGGRITVVYLTRTPGSAPVGLNIRRTVIYVVGGDTLHEVSHTDVSL